MYHKRTITVDSNVHLYGDMETHVRELDSGVITLRLGSPGAPGITLYLHEEEGEGSPLDVLTKAVLEARKIRVQQHEKRRAA